MHALRPSGGHICNEGHWTIKERLPHTAQGKERLLLPLDPDTGGLAHHSSSGACRMKERVRACLRPSVTDPQASEGTMSLGPESVPSGEPGGWGWDPSPAPSSMAVCPQVNDVTSLCLGASPYNGRAIMLHWIVAKVSAFPGRVPAQSQVEVGSQEHHCRRNDIFAALILRVKR